MPHYRKKPVEIEAMELRMDNMAEIMAWVPGTKHWSKLPMRQVTGLLIPTLESPHEASFGDFIIKGVNGEFYPCKPDIFKKTYVEVVSTEQLIDILGHEKREGPLIARIETHDGYWERNEDRSEYAFNWTVFE